MHIKDLIEGADCRCALCQKKLRPGYEVYTKFDGDARCVIPLHKKCKKQLVKSSQSIALTIG